MPQYDYSATSSRRNSSWSEQTGEKTRGHSFEQSTSGKENEDVKEAAAPVGTQIDVEKQKPPPAADAVDWEHDPDNAYNWPYWMKVFHTAIPALLAFVVTVSSSIYTPGREDVMRDFGITSTTVALLPYSFFVFGLSLGPMISAPCSETFGRLPVYQTCIPIFGLFIMGAGFSKDIVSLTICRFFAGVFGSPGLTVAAGTLTEIWRPIERSIPMSAYVTTPFLGPALGPLLGGYVTLGKGWRWTQWTILFFLVTFLLPSFLMRETYKKVILQRRAKKAAKQAGTSLPPGPNGWQVAKTFITATLTRPVHMLVTEPIVALFSLYVAFNFAVLYLFFAAFTYVWTLKYGFDIGQQGLTFIGMGVGVLIGFGLLVLNTKKVYMPMVIKWKTEQARKAKELEAYKAQYERANSEATLHGECSDSSSPVGREKPSPPPAPAAAPPPELMLYVAFPGAIVLPISLFLFAWTANYSVHWIVPVIAEAGFGMGSLVVFMSCSLYLMDTYGPLYGASAMAANNLLRYALGGAFPLFSLQMYETLGVGWATSLLGFISVILAMIPFAFMKYGPRLRAMSRYQK